MERKFVCHLGDIDNVFDVTSKLNEESKSHLNECIMLESSNEDVIIEAEQRLHSIQEEERNLELKMKEIAKVFSLISELE